VVIAERVQQQLKQARVILEDENGSHAPGFVPLEGEPA
jgi:hypothetical protein